MANLLPVRPTQEKEDDMKCKNCESVELVHSGVDAFCLGVEAGVYCYPCANYEAFKREVA